MKYFKKILKESIIIIIITTLFGIFSGSVLSANEKILYTFPIILLILPSFNDLIGDISTILVNRLTTALYLGTIPAKIQKSEKLREDLLGLFFTILICLSFLIVIGYIIGYISNIQIINPFIIIFIIILTAIVNFSIMFTILLISSIFLFKRGKDPNNFLIPFITTLADFLTPSFLILFILIFIL